MTLYYCIPLLILWDCNILISIKSSNWSSYPLLAYFLNWKTARSFLVMPGWGTPHSTHSLYRSEERERGMKGLIQTESRYRLPFSEILRGLRFLYSPLEVHPFHLSFRLFQSEFHWITTKFFSVCEVLIDSLSLSTFNSPCFPFVTQNALSSSPRSIFYFFFVRYGIGFSERYHSSVGVSLTGRM